MEMRLAALMNQTYGVNAQARSVREQLQKISKQASAPLGEGIKALDKKLEAILGARGGFFGPVSPELTLGRLRGEVGALYGGVGNADATPTASQVAALAGIERDFPTLMKRWLEVKATDLPALNRQLRGENLPEVRLESKPEPERD
jgi:hypothetical protein